MNWSKSQLKVEKRIEIRVWGIDFFFFNFCFLVGIFGGFFLVVLGVEKLDACPTYQTDEQKENQKSAPEHRLTVDVTIAHRRHGHNQEIDTRPIRQSIRIVEFQWIPRIFQLWNTIIRSNQFTIEFHSDSFMPCLTCTWQG